MGFKAETAVAVIQQNAVMQKKYKDDAPIIIHKSSGKFKFPWIDRLLYSECRYKVRLAMINKLLLKTHESHGSEILDRLGSDECITSLLAASEFEVMESIKHPHYCIRCCRHDCTNRHMKTS